MDKVHLTSKFEVGFDDDVEAFKLIKQKIYDLFEETQTRYFSIVPTVTKTNKTTGETSVVHEPIRLVAYMKTQDILVVQAFKGHNPIYRGEVMWFDIRKVDLHKINDIDNSVWEYLLKKLGEFQPVDAETEITSLELVSTWAKQSVKFLCCDAMFFALLQQVIENHNLALEKYLKNEIKPNLDDKDVQISELKTQVALLKVQLKREKQKTDHLAELLLEKQEDLLKEQQKNNFSTSTIVWRDC